MDRLNGRVAFITGGARGQGRAIAERFALEGADIVLCDVGQRTELGGYESASARDLDYTAAQVVESGRRCVAEVADVRDQVALDRVVARGIAELGRIDILIANAGVLDERPFWEISDEEWRSVLDINLMGAWHSAKAVASHMMKRLTGCIIFTSSVMGREGGAGAAHYAASKAGVLSLSRSIALELAPFNVRVNAVLPGGVDTPMGNSPGVRARTVGREGATRDDYLERSRSWYALRGRTALPATAIADAMTWLASDEAQQVTGIELVVDGGHSLLPRSNPAPVV